MYKNQDLFYFVYDIIECRIMQGFLLIKSFSHCLHNMSNVLYGHQLFERLLLNKNQLLQQEKYQ